MGVHWRLLACGRRAGRRKEAGLTVAVRWKWRFTQVQAHECGGKWRPGCRPLINAKPFRVASQNHEATTLTTSPHHINLRYALRSTTAATCRNLGYLACGMQDNPLESQRWCCLSASLLLSQRDLPRHTDCTADIAHHTLPAAARTLFSVYPRHRQTPHQTQQSWYLVNCVLQTTRLPFDSTARSTSPD